MKYLVLALLALSQLAAADKAPDRVVEAAKLTARAAKIFNEGYKDQKVVKAIEAKMTNAADKKYLRSLGLKAIAPKGYRAVAVIDSLTVLRGNKVALAARILKLKPLTVEINGKRTVVDTVNIRGASKTAAFFELILPTADAAGGSIDEKVTFILATLGYAPDVAGGEPFNDLKAAMSTMELGPRVTCGVGAIVDYSVNDLKLGITAEPIDANVENSPWQVKFARQGPPPVTCAVAEPIPCIYSAEKRTTLGLQYEELQRNRATFAEAAHRLVADRYGLDKEAVSTIITAIDCPTNQCTMTFNDPNNFTSAQMAEIRQLISSYSPQGEISAARVKIRELDQIMSYAGVTDALAAANDEAKVRALTYMVGALATCCQSSACREEALNKLGTDLVPDGAPAPSTDQ